MEHVHRLLLGTVRFRRQLRQFPCHEQLNDTVAHPGRGQHGAEVGPFARVVPHFLAELAPGVELLENLRFDPGEESCDAAFVARLAADDLSVIDKIPAPPGTTLARVLGPLGRRRYLCACFGAPGRPVFSLQLETWTREDFVYAGRTPLATGKTGWFLRQIEDRIELWDMRAQRCGRVLFKNYRGYRILTQEDSVYLVYPKEIIVLDDCLAGLK